MGIDPLEASIDNSGSRNPLTHSPNKKLYFFTEKKPTGRNLWSPLEFPAKTLISAPTTAQSVSARSRLLS